MLSNATMLEIYIRFESQLIYVTALIGSKPSVVRKQKDRSLNTIYKIFSWMSVERNDVLYRCAIGINFYCAYWCRCHDPN